jgi:hypothetical protein
MEALLEIVGILLPEKRKADQGRANRIKFIEAIFQSPGFEKFDQGKPFIELLRNVSNKDWDITLEKMIDVFAKHDVT